MVPAPLSLSVCPSSPGSYFANHFIMGGEKFDSTHPEGYLFGENSDLNFLGNRPVLVGTGGDLVSVRPLARAEPAEWILCCLISRLAACHPLQGTGPCPLLGCLLALAGSQEHPRARQRVASPFGCRPKARASPPSHPGGVSYPRCLAGMRTGCWHAWFGDGEGRGAGLSQLLSLSESFLLSPLTTQP